MVLSGAVNCTSDFSSVLVSIAVFMDDMWAMQHASLSAKHNSIMLLH